MKIENFCEFNNYISGISIEMDDDDASGAVNPAEIPFPQCKIMQVSHHSFFTDRPSMARDFQLDGDEILESRDRSDRRTFWVPLSCARPQCAERTGFHRARTETSWQLAGMPGERAFSRSP